MQEKKKNKSWQIQMKELQQKIVDLGYDPSNPKPIKDLIKEKIMKFKF